MPRTYQGGRPTYFDLVGRTGDGGVSVTGKLGLPEAQGATITATVPGAPSGDYVVPGFVRTPNWAEILVYGYNVTGENPSVGELQASIDAGIPPFSLQAQVQRQQAKKSLLERIGDSVGGIFNRFAGGVLSFQVKLLLLAGVVYLIYSYAPRPKR